MTDIVHRMSAAARWAPLATQCMAGHALAQAPGAVVTAQNALSPALLVAAVSAAFAVLAIVLLWRALSGARQEPYELRRHWGGFGGTRTGWGISRPLMELFAALVLALLSGALGLKVLEPEKSSTSGSSRVQPASPPAAQASSPKT